MNNLKKTKKIKTSNIGKYLIGKPVIVRANVAGVHAGIVQAIEGTTIVLTSVYRLWRVYTRDMTGSISDVAANGLKPGADHNIGMKLVSVLIENPSGLEVAEMTQDAYTSIVNYAAKCHVYKD